MSKKTEVIRNPHDQFFRESMKDPRIAQEFLKTHLPDDLRTLVNFNVLELQPRSQSNAVRRESIVDVLFKTKIDGKEAYLYLLLEHQSTPDPLMSFRVLQYTVNAIHEHLRHHKTTKIPLIYPLVVYHGRPYQFITNINELVDAPKELVDRYFLKPFQLLDLNQIDDDVIRQDTWSGIIKFVLKHIFDSDMLPVFLSVIPILKFLIENDGHDVCGIVLQYAIESGEFSDVEAFFDLINKNVSHEVGESIMSLADKLRHEGKLEGELNKEREIAKRMLDEGAEPAFVAKVTGLSLDKIKVLQKH
jgi:predicted transposase/invertase (TIGR01784 family)